jgi:hypothetical protein
MAEGCDSGGADGAKSQGPAPEAKASLSHTETVPTASTMSMALPGS